MRIRTSYFIYSISHSFWFIPALMVIGGILLSVVATTLDQTLLKDTTIIGAWMQNQDRDIIRDILTAIATSMISVAGVVYSVTVVVLSLASQQFGSSLIRDFMRDKSNQSALGVFITTFVYSVITLARLPEESSSENPGRLSITIGIILAVASIYFLVFIIHHLSRSMLSFNIVASIANDFEDVGVHIFSQKKPWYGTQSSRQEKKPAPELSEKGSRSLFSLHCGYLKFVNVDKMVNLASKYDLIVRLECRPGNFITQGNTLATVWGGEKLTARAENKIRRMLILGTERTPVQDVEYIFDQLVEVAMRDMTENLTDILVAMAAIDWIGEGLAYLMERGTIPRYKYDRQGNLRVITKELELNDLINLLFSRLRHSANNNPALNVTMSVYLLRVIFRLALHVKTDTEKQILLEQAQKIRKSAIEEKSADENDRTEIQNSYLAVQKQLVRI